MEGRSLFEFQKGAMDIYFLQAGDVSIVHDFSAITVSDIELFWQKIHGTFVSNQPKSRRPFLHVASSEFRRSYGKLLNASDFW